MVAGNDQVDKISYLSIQLHAREGLKSLDKSGFLQIQLSDFIYQLHRVLKKSSLYVHRMNGRYRRGQEGKLI